jgi:hypothetical protein
MATQKIFARSPYYVSYKAAVNTIATVNVSVWAYEGVKTTDRPATPLYELKKTTSVREGVYEWWTFEVAELLKDYLPKVGDPTTYPATAMWGGIQISKTSATGTTITSSVEDFAVFDGYIKFEEGSQSMVGVYSSAGGGTVAVSFDTPTVTSHFTEIQINQNFFQSKDKYSTFIPIYQSDTTAGPSVNYYGSSGQFITTQGTPSNNSADIIQYLTYSNTYIDSLGLTKATWANLTLVTYDNIDCIPDFTNNSTGTIIWFLNRFGAIDKVTFMGLKTDNYETSKNEYRANIVGAKTNGYWGYETYQRQKSILNKKGKRKFSLNTGWIAENYNDKIEDLLLAEQVWINKGSSSSSAYPVNIITSNIQEKTDANEKVINYAIEFEYANDIQNNIR